VVSNFEIIQWFSKKGIENNHPMNVGGTYVQDGIQFKSVNAVHSSSMPDGSYGGQASGWLIQAEGLSVYYAGDTALSLDMRLIAMHQPTHAILPIGDNFTMGVEDAVTCSDMIKCNNIIGMHYDTFPMIQINHERAINEFNRAGKLLTLMPIGSTIELK
jgi:L-ascorbate metabolism protein UlaG (beta-lactamase superfamily)